MSYQAARGSPPRAGHSLHAPRRWPSGGGPGSNDLPTADFAGPQFSATASPRSVNSRDRFADAASDRAGGGGGREFEDPRHHPPSSWITGPGPSSSNQMPESQLPWASGDESTGSYPQERLPSSQSMSSMAYNSRGRRAPAPAALDLGHRERVYSAEPEPLPYTSDRRLELTMVSSAPPDYDRGGGAAVVPRGASLTSQPVPRPLPTAPAGRRVSMQQVPPHQPASPPRTEPVPFPTHHSLAASRTSPPQTVPLSAVGGLGLGPLDDQRASVVMDPRASVATNGGDRVSYVSCV